MHRQKARRSQEERRHLRSKQTVKPVFINITGVEIKNRYKTDARHSNDYCGIDFNLCQHSKIPLEQKIEILDVF